MNAPENRAPRLRILHLAFDDPRRPGSGGGAIRNHEINRELARRHEVTALTVSYPGAHERVEDGVRYVPIGLPLGYYGAILTYFMCLPVVVLRRHYDLLVEDFAAPFGSVLVAKWTRGKAIGHVQWLSADEKAAQYHLPFGLTERWGVRSHRLLIAVSNQVAERLRRLNPKAEVVVLPNGLDMAVWDVARVPRTGDLVYLGRLETKGKGLDLLLDAFASIRARTKANLLIAGDGPDRALVEEMVRRRNLRDRVKLLGRIAGKARFDLLAGAQVACMPTRYESFGLVALEAMACGTPVVAFDIPAMRELVSAETGILAPAFDVNAYADALLELLDDRERSARLGAAGRRRARGYDWAEVARGHEQLYLRFARHSGGGGPGAELARRARLLPAAADSLPTLDLRSLARVVAVPAAPAACAVAAFALRAALVPRGFETHVDEVIYLHISENVARGIGLVYRLTGDYLFFLHPPLEFGLEAMWLKLIGIHGGPVDQVISVRYFVAAVGGLSAAIIFLLCRALAGTLAAWVGGLVFTLEPFIVRMDTRNFLEASAMLWALLGILAVLALRRGRRSSRPRLIALLGGTAFGAALLTNEPAAMVTLLPLAAVTALRLIRFRRAATIATTAVALYSVYPVTVWLTGSWAEFWSQKTAGVNRFIGLSVTTGFNGASGPSFVRSLVENWSLFAPTYTLLGCGVLATGWLAFQPDVESRLVAVWTAGGYALQAYSVLFGTNEEQYFYYVTVLAVLAVVTAARHIFDGEPLASHRGRRLRMTAFAVGIPVALAVAGALLYRQVAAVVPTLQPRDYIRALVLLVPILTAVWAARAVLARLPPEERRRWGHGTWQTALLMLFVIVSSSVAVSRYTTPDDGYQRLLAYASANIPAGTPIAASNGADVAVFRAAGYPVTDFDLVDREERSRTKISDPAVLLRGDPRYVVISTRLTQEGYGAVSPTILTWLRANATEVFSFSGPSDGELQLYQLPAAASR
jgi:glycogen(starch) synthase